MFLPSEIEKKSLIVTPALWITVKPALGDQPFVKLKVVSQCRDTYSDRYCHYIAKAALINCVNDNADTVVVFGWYRLSSKRPIISAREDQQRQTCHSIQTKQCPPPASPGWSQERILKRLWWWCGRKLFVMPNQWCQSSECISIS